MATVIPSVRGRGIAPAPALLDPHHPLHVAHDGYTVLVTRPDGSIEGVEREGLYDFDTRILSRHRLTIDGRAPEWSGGGVIVANRWLARTILRRGPGTAAGPVLPQDVFAVELRRRLECGMTETVVVRNHSMAPADVELAIELAADFADVQEVGSATRRQQGRVDVQWSAAHSALELRYHVAIGERELERGLRVTVRESDSPPECDGTTLRFALHLAPRGAWSLELAYASRVDGVWREPPAGGEIDAAHGRDARRRAWERARTRLVADDPLIVAVFDRAANDLLALRNWEYDVAPDAWVANAGVPTYTGLFGRDLLTTGWQAAMLGPEMLRGAFACLAARQATEDDPWRDEEPGKFPHEVRRGPLSELDLTPHRAYYGEQTAPAMFVVALSEYWHWTGDDAAVERYLPAARRALEWAERCGDADGDGLLEYRRRSPVGLKNQAWKDSDEAIRYPDGTIVPNPIATIEEQAYHYTALQRMAEMLIARGADGDAERFLDRARTLARRVDEAFWMPEAGFYAMALDPDKRPVASIGSNAGHAFAAGLVAPERARMAAERLLAPDLFSGWGVRTLSTEHPSYNPYAYHLGTVWPVENATIALGFKRYGLDEYADRLITPMLAAAAHFSAYRLPEALGGHARAADDPPTVYPASNAPQAWSASAVVQLVQVMLGIYPFAPARILALVRPQLPTWLPSLVLERVRVGDATVSLRFERRADGSVDHDVIARGGSGTVHVVSAMPPDDVGRRREHFGERVREWAVRHAPGSMARALRIAVGLET